MQRFDNASQSTKHSYSSHHTDLTRNVESTNRPVRKRSKVSKNTPTTHLNANATEFRALVQQFTGCRSSTAHKGPINLNFAVPTQCFDFKETSNESLLRYNHYNYTPKNHHEQLRQTNCRRQLDHDEKFREDGSGLFAYDVNVVSDDAVVSTLSNPMSEDLTLDDFDYIENIFPQDLFEDYSSSGTMINDDFWGYYD